MVHIVANTTGTAPSASASASNRTTAWTLRLSSNEQRPRSAAVVFQCSDCTSKSWTSCWDYLQTAYSAGHRRGRHCLKRPCRPNMAAVSRSVAGDQTNKPASYQPTTRDRYRPQALQAHASASLGPSYSATETSQHQQAREHYTPTEWWLWLR
jgi:hypothetical protein